MTESSEVEYPVIRWLEKYKIKHRKMNGIGQRGWPDRLICLPVYPLWLEFKREGETLQKLQVYRIKILRELGYDVQVYDKADEAIVAIQSAIKARLVAALVSKENNKIRAAKLMCRIVFGPRPRKDEHNPRRNKDPKEGKARK